MHAVQSQRIRGVGSLSRTDGSLLLEVTAFGRLSLKSRDSTLSVFPTRKTEDLLAFLILHQEMAHAREKLVEMLWPGAPNATGRGRLNTTLWRIRRVFKELGIPPESVIIADSETVEIKVIDTSWVDVFEFERCLKEAESAADDDEKETLYQRAASLYKGDLLEGIYSDWCLVEREKLARNHLRILGQLMSFTMAREEYEAATDLGHQILEHDPLREEVHRALMICYDASGQRSDGIRQFQRCANLLLSELGIIPLPETIAIYQGLIAAAAGQSLEAADDPGSQDDLRRTFSEFMAVGDELLELMGALQ